jgi:hypothetical protein
MNEPTLAGKGQTMPDHMYRCVAEHAFDGECAWVDFADEANPPLHLVIVSRDPATFERARAAINWRVGQLLSDEMVERFWDFGADVKGVPP